VDGKIKGGSKLQEKLKLYSKSYIQNNGFLLMKFILHFILPVLVLIIAAWIAYSYLQDSPTAKRVPPKHKAPLVETTTLERATHKVNIEAMGVVKPALQINLKPRVNGQIMEVSPEFIPGGYFKRDEVILKLDPADFELVVREAQANVDMARSALELEQGQQAIARKEFELLGKKVDENDDSLVLRKPQLAAAKAELDKAESTLQQSRLDLQRTVIRSPFNARIRSRDADLGLQVTSANSLAVLSGTDQYWIELTVPVNHLKWIKIPQNSSEPGSIVNIFDENAWGENTKRTGQVIRLAADLETEGRLARLLVAVDDPMSLLPENQSQPSLILGSFMHVQIEGINLPDSIAIDRKLLRDGDTIWVLNDADQLEIRQIKTTYEGVDYVLVTAGVTTEDRIITTYLSAAVAGMPLRAVEQRSTQVSAQ
tara:strand:- start:5235 stop:6512 length:1278 start_codon:yes stop_codon:yes gene_type:complete